MSDRPAASTLPVQRVLHVLNYGWPHIDGYTVRSSGLITAQQRYLGLDVAVAVSPFEPLAGAQDPQFETPAWQASTQISAQRYRENDQDSRRLRRFERPGLGLAPATRREFHAELTSIVRRLEPDLVHVHHPHYVGDVAIVVARQFGLPCVYELRCFNGDYDLGREHPYARLRGRLFNRRETAVCNRADAVVTLSDGLAQRIVAGGTEADRVFVVRNSVDTDRFAPRANRSAPSNDTTRRIGYACTFSEIEGLDLLIDAVAELPESTRHQLEVVLAGQGSDYDRIAARVAERGLEETVKLPGFIAYGDMPSFYDGLDLFVVPRKASPVANTTTPLKPLEARAAGVPLLVSDLPALKELLGASAHDVRYVAPEADSLAAGLAAFIDHPWPGATGADDSRSWRREIECYRAVYERAVDHADSSSDATSARPALRERATRHIRSLARRIPDSGAPGLRALDTHVVVCGFPRTGSTLLQLMIESCIADVRTFDGEIKALWAARYALRNHAYMVTKYPRDIECIDAIRAHYRSNNAQAHFVVTLRDPRAVLTSAHKAYPSSRGYYVDFARWQAIYDIVDTLDRSPDITFVRYEDLVTDPNRVQQQLAEDIGWNNVHDFSHYDDRVRARNRSRDSMTEGALGGLRAVDNTRLAPWLAPEHSERVRAMLSAIPLMPDYLIKLGYEPDYRWIDEIS